MCQKCHFSGKAWRSVKLRISFNGKQLDSHLLTKLKSELMAEVINIGLFTNFSCVLHHVILVFMFWLRLKIRWGPKYFALYCCKIFSSIIGLLDHEPLWGGHSSRCPNVASIWAMMMINNAGTCLQSSHQMSGIVWKDLVWWWFQSVPAHLTMLYREEERSLTLLRQFPRHGEIFLRTLAEHSLLGLRRGENGVRAYCYLFIFLATNTIQWRCNDRCLLQTLQTITEGCKTQHSNRVSHFNFTLM